MTVEEFTKIANAANSSSTVIEVVVATGQTELKGSGALEFSPGKFALKFTCLEGEPPELPPIIHREQFWTVTGKFASGLQFTCRNVPPPSAWKWRWDSPKLCAFKLESIELEADGFDALTYDEFEENLHRAAAVGSSLGHKPIERQRILKRRSGVFHILIPKCSLLIGTQEVRQIVKHPFLGDTVSGVGRLLQGRVANFEYCLTEKGGDLAVDVRSKLGKPTSEVEDRRFSEALLDSISFTHGQQIQRFHVQYFRDHKLIENCFRPTGPLVRTSHIPFPERLCIERAFNERPFDFQAAFELVLSAYLNPTFPSEIRDYLSELQLTSVSGMNPSHSRLAVCRIFEGVVNLLFDDLGLSEVAKASLEVQSFNKAKISTVRWLSKRKRQGFKRLHSIIQNATPLTTAEKFRAVLQHYRMHFEGIPKQILSDWKERRNPLAHGRSDVEEGNQENLKAWFAQSRIAGGVIMLILKRMGYRGPMRISSLENTYIEI
jgi:hypothetical protein